MKVIKAGEEAYRVLNRVNVFLAGGTTGANWREYVIDILNLRYEDNDSLRIINPINEHYDYEFEKQIHWEVNSLINSDLIGFYFYGTTSDSPISFFELGMYLSTIKQRCSYGMQDPNRLVEIAVSDDFCKKNELIYRCREVGFSVDVLRGTPEENYEDIAFKLTCKIDNLLR